jgi:hypothetical protein
MPYIGLGDCPEVFVKGPAVSVAAHLGVPVADANMNDE